MGDGPSQEAIVRAIRILKLAARRYLSEQAKVDAEAAVNSTDERGQNGCQVAR